LAAVEERVRAMDERSEKERAEEKQLRLQAEERRTEEAKLKEALTEVAKMQEKLLNKRSMALQKRETNLKKIQVRVATRGVICHSVYDLFS
jgi:hypothetical protein